MSIPEWSHYYEVSADSLADWIERQGTDKWWVIDGDNYLSSRVMSPCPTAALVRVLRQVNRSLLVQTLEPQATGQVVGPDKLDQLTDRLGEDFYKTINPDLPKPTWVDDRCLWLCWKGQNDEWMLAEDSQATAAFKNVKSSRTGNT
jgi:hypothetical protein